MEEGVVRVADRGAVGKAVGDELYMCKSSQVEVMKSEDICSMGIAFLL